MFICFTSLLLLLFVNPISKHFSIFLFPLKVLSSVFIELCVFQVLWSRGLSAGQVGLLCLCRVSIVSSCWPLLGASFLIFKLFFLGVFFLVSPLTAWSTNLKLPHLFGTRLGGLGLSLKQLLAWNLWRKHTWGNKHQQKYQLTCWLTCQLRFKMK